MDHETTKALLKAQELMEKIDKQTASFELNNYQHELTTQLLNDIKDQASEHSFIIFSEIVADSYGGSLQDILNTSRKQGIDAKSIELIKQAITQYNHKNRSLRPSLMSKLPHDLRLQLLEFYYTLEYIAITLAVWGVILFAAYWILIEDIFDLF